MASLPDTQTLPKSIESTYHRNVSSPPPVKFALPLPRLSKTLEQWNQIQPPLSLQNQRTSRPSTLMHGLTMRTLNHWTTLLILSTTPNVHPLLHQHHRPKRYSRTFSYHHRHKNPKTT